MYFELFESEFFWRVLQCVAMCYNDLQCVVVTRLMRISSFSSSVFVCVCFSALQCVAVIYNVLQYFD